MASSGSLFCFLHLQWSTTQLPLPILHPCSQSAEPCQPTATQSLQPSPKAAVSIALMFHVGRRLQLPFHYTATLLIPFFDSTGAVLFVILKCIHLCPETRPWGSPWNWVPMVNPDVIRALYAICSYPCYFHRLCGTSNVSELTYGFHPPELTSRSPRCSVPHVLLCHTHSSFVWITGPTI